MLGEDTHRCFPWQAQGPSMYASVDAGILDHGDCWDWVRMGSADSDSDPNWHSVEVDIHRDNCAWDRVPIRIPGPVHGGGAYHGLLIPCQGLGWRISLSEIRRKRRIAVGHSEIGADKAVGTVDIHEGEGDA